MNENKVNKAIKWGELIYQLDIGRIDTGEREFLNAKIAYELEKFDDAKRPKVGEAADAPSEKSGIALDTLGARRASKRGEGEDSCAYRRGVRQETVANKRHVRACATAMRCDAGSIRGDTPPDSKSR